MRRPGAQASPPRGETTHRQLPHLFVKPAASAPDTRTSSPPGERGAQRVAPPPPRPLRHAGPSLGRPVGRERHVTRRASPSPRAGLLLRPPGGFHHVARGRRPAHPSPERGRGARRRGKGREKGREEESKGAEPESRDTGAARKAPRRSLAPPFSCSCLSLLPGRAPADQGRGGLRLRRRARECPDLVWEPVGNARAGVLRAGGGARP